VLEDLGQVPDDSHAELDPLFFSSRVNLNVSRGLGEKYPIHGGYPGDIYPNNLSPPWRVL